MGNFLRGKRPLHLKQRAQSCASNPGPKRERGVCPPVACAPGSGKWYVRARGCLVLALAAAALSVAPTSVYSFNEPSDEPEPAAAEGFRRLTKQMHRLDWDKERPFIERALQNVWESSGWTDESDRFARDLACEVASIPPWEPLKRLHLFNERVTGRYGLSKDEKARFQNAVMREAGGLLMRHTGVILEQAREGMQARLRGKPFTAEQIRRWTKQSRPMVAEMRKSVDRLVVELRPMVEPGKRRILEGDVKSIKKRKRHMDVLRARWEKGQWEPEDWGLQNDPTHTTTPPVGQPEAARAARKPPAAPTGRQQPKPTKIPHWVAYKPSTWFAYVLDCEKRFNLDAGQMSTADSIHAELLDRADRYAKAHADTLEAIPARERASHEAFEPIRSLFGELQSRLDVIPTTSQRDRGEQ